MANGLVYARGKKAKGICDRCGLEYPLRELRFELLSAQPGGPPLDEISNLRVCRKCLDKPHPQNFLPVAVREKLPDAEQLYQPRTDIFPKAYPVVFNTPGAIYLRNAPLPLAQGFSGTIIAKGMFGGYTATVAAPVGSGIVIDTATLVSPSLVVITLAIAGGAIPGIYIVTVTDGQQNQTKGQIEIL